MAIRDVVTMGFANGTFSPGIAQVVRLGYGEVGTTPFACSAKFTSEAITKPTFATEAIAAPQFASEAIEKC